MEFNNQYDIVLNNDPYLVDFYNKLSDYLSNHKSVYDVSVCNKRAALVFNPYYRNKSLPNWNDHNTYFFYFNLTFFNLGYEQYSDNLWYGQRKLLIPFNNEEHCINCYLTIHKEGGNKKAMNQFYNLIFLLEDYLYIKNPYIYIPWLDFSKTYTTEELFNIIGMKYNKKEIDKILNGK